MSASERPFLPVEEWLDLHGVTLGYTSKAAVERDIREGKLPAIRLQDYLQAAHPEMASMHIGAPSWILPPVPRDWEPEAPTSYQVLACVLTKGARAPISIPMGLDAPAVGYQEVLAKAVAKRLAKEVQDVVVVRLSFQDQRGYVHGSVLVNGQGEEIAADTAQARAAGAKIEQFVRSRSFRPEGFLAAVKDKALGLLLRKPAMPAEVAPAAAPEARTRVVERLVFVPSPAAVPTPGQPAPAPAPASAEPARSEDRAPAAANPEVATTSDQVSAKAQPAAAGAPASSPAPREKKEKVAGPVAERVAGAPEPAAGTPIDILLVLTKGTTLKDRLGEKNAIYLGLTTQAKAADGLVPVTSRCYIAERSPDDAKALRILGYVPFQAVSSSGEGRAATSYLMVDATKPVHLATPIDLHTGDDLGFPTAIKNLPLPIGNLGIEGKHKMGDSLDWPVAGRAAAWRYLRQQTTDATAPGATTENAGGSGLTTEQQTTHGQGTA